MQVELGMRLDFRQHPGHRRKPHQRFDRSVLLARQKQFTFAAPEEGK